MRIVLLDACRNDPFQAINQTTGHGLSIVDARTCAPGTLINWTPYAVGVVLHEFENQASGSYTSAAARSPTYQMTTDRVGTFYQLSQLSAGLSAVALNNGLLGFVRGDYRFGDRINGGGGGGLR